MITLTVNQNQIDYAGALEKPAFSLIGKARRIIEGLYNCFAAHQVTLSDFRADETVTNPSTWGVNVYLKSLGVYRFRFDRLEWTAAGFSDDDLRLFPEIIKQGEEWLRSAAQGVSFKSHTFLYAAHCKLSEGTSQDFLLGLQEKDPI